MNGLLFLSEKWATHADFETVRWIQAKDQEEESNTPSEYMSSEEDATYSGKRDSSEDATNDTSAESSEEVEVPLTVNKFSVLSTEI